MKVLIVDDSSVMRKIVMRNLRQANIQVDQELEAGDGVEALKVLSENPIDLILCDINMPNMDGYQFIDELKKRSDFDSIKIVIITTEANVDKVHEAITKGADGYIVKPFTPEQLAEKIESAMD